MTWHTLKTQSDYVFACALPTDSCSKACSYFEMTWVDLTCLGLVWLSWAWFRLIWLDLPWLDLAYLELRWVHFEVNWIWTAPSWMKLAGVASETKIESLGLEVGIGHANCTWTSPQKIPLFSYAIAHIAIKNAQHFDLKSCTIYICISLDNKKTFRPSNCTWM